jgi:hypothetical protein
MKIIGANVTGSFILNGQDVTNTLQSSSIWSGSVASSITNLNSATASLNAATASLYNYTSSNTMNVVALFAASASLNSSVASLNTATSSFSSSIGLLNAATASFSSSIGSLNATTASLLSYTASQTALNSTFATTGSNSFNGTQTITGSITTSGSITATGTITAQTLVVQTITSSVDFVTGSTRFGSLLANTHVFTGSVSVTGSINATSLTGSINGSQITDATVSNAKLANSTISGISLGSNLAILTIGTGLSGTSYNGSTGITIANTGVTSITAGTGISINQGTGGVTITNTINNTNQLTNGAGYITSAALSSYLPLSGGNITGNLTVGGPASALAQLHVYNASAAASFLLQTNSSTDYAEIATRNYNQTSTAYYRQYSSSASGTDFGVSRNNLAALFSNYASNFAIGTQNGGDLILGTANTERMRINTTGIATFSGRIILGTFPNSQTNTGEAWIGRASDRNAGTMTVQLGGNSASSRSFEVVDYAWSVVLFSVSSGGTATASGDVVAYSDARVKTNIKPIDSSLEKVSKLTGVTYNRTDLEDKSTKIGFIAQEVEKVIPEVVTYDSEKDRYGVSYGNVTALLVEAIKEQQTQIEELKTIINGLTK